MGFVENISDHIEDVVHYVINHLLPAFAVLLAFFVAGWLIPKIVAEILRRFYIFSERFVMAVKIVLRVTIDVLGIIEWIVLLGIDMTTALVSFGVLSLAVSIALSGPLGNIASGVFIQLFGTAERGDVVSAAGVRGTIVHFGVIHVHIVGSQEKILYEYKVPNAVFNQSVVIVEPPLAGDEARATDPYALRPKPPPYAGTAYVETPAKERPLNRWTGNQPGLVV